MKRTDPASQTDGPAARQDPSGVRGAPADVEPVEGSGGAPPARGKRASTPPARRAHAAGAGSAQPTQGTDASDDGGAGRLQMIAVAAYYRAERRAFADGLADDDWLDAEREIDLLLKGPVPGAAG
jgi:hypothetical protein